MEKVGLVLEGGGMRGLYTSGVLDFFLEKELFFDGVIGVSAGALNAVSYLSRQKGRNLRINTNYLKDKNFMSFTSLCKTGSLFGMDFLFHEIPDRLDPFDYDTFHAQTSQFICVSSNLHTGQAYYRNIKDLRKEIDFLKASSSLPLLAPVVECNGYSLLDGGVADSIPIQYMRSHNYAYNVVILTQDASYQKGKNRLMPIIRHQYKQYPAFIKALETRHIRYNQTIAKLQDLAAKDEVFIIQPQKPVNISRIEKDKNKLIALYQDGYHDAQNTYEKLLEFLQRKQKNNLQIV